jgi:hypothetical protein
MRLWTLWIVPAIVCLLVAACGSGNADIYTPKPDAGSDVTVAPPPQALGDGGGGTACTSKTCAMLGFTCGKNSDGCGNMIDCGTCTSPAFCGGGGFSQCGGNAVAADAGGSVCVPKTCAQLAYTCGQNSDGCGNILSCGSCAAPQFCGGGGYSQCGGNAVVADGGGLCVPKTCLALGYGCGPAGDGCGNMLDCGTCMSPAFCGGGGFATCGGNATVADGGTVCVPTTCAALNYACGPAGDGCGNMLSCGTCTAPAFCGGGGFNQCGGNSVVAEGGSACVPKTCAQQGFNCGPADDGCGNLIQCGSCQAPLICGGGGQPSVCGDNVPCTGLCQNQMACSNGMTTTFTGQVVAGTQAPYGAPDPVPNVIVYVPNGPVLPFSQGVECSQCGADVTGSPLVEATTNYLGNFTLTNVPVPPSGMVPVVIQLGRWRRQLSFPVTACKTTNLGQIPMPRTQSATDDIPFTAISTGDVDAMECVLLKMGVDVSEFTPPGGGGRIEMYQGNGADDDYQGFTPAESQLIDSPSTLAEYDQVLFPCWGEDPRPSGVNYNGGNVKTSTEQKNVINYTNAGGRMFATHFSYTWLYNDAPFSGTATWIDDVEPNSATAVIQQSPADVDVMYLWMNALASNGASAGKFTVTAPRNDFSGINAAESELWMKATNPSGGDPAPSTFPLLYTFNTPVGAQKPVRQGRVQRFPRDGRQHQQRRHVRLLVPRRVHDLPDERAGEGARVPHLGPCLLRPGPAVPQVHTHDLRRPESQLRSGRRWLRQPAQLRHMHAPADLRRRRPVRAVRQHGWWPLRAADMRSREHRVRSGRRRLRQPDPVRTVHASPDVWGRWSGGTVRLGRRRELHAPDLRPREHRMRSGRRRLRQSHSVRAVHAPADVWRRRPVGSVWLGGRRQLHAPDVPAAGRELRPRGGRVRRVAPVRHLHATADLRGRRAGERLRLHRRRQLHPHDMPGARRDVRADGRRLRRAARLRGLRRTRDLRRRRNTRRLWRRHALIVVAVVVAVEVAVEVDVETGEAWRLQRARHVRSDGTLVGAMRGRPMCDSHPHERGLVHAVEHRRPSRA